MATQRTNYAEPEYYGPGDDIEQQSSEPAIAALDVLTRSEINQQIQAALAHPRDVTKFRKELLALATTSEVVAQECFYTLERKDKNNNKVYIVGPSIRFAEMLLYSWGNTRAGARVTSTEGDFLSAQGVFQDLERNNADTFEVQRRITTSSGKRYGADMIQVTGNAACSLAYRNAVTHGIPKALWNDIFEKTKLAAIGKAENMGAARNKALEYAAKMHVTPDMIYTTLSISGIEGLGAEELAVLRGLFASVKDGNMTIEDAFGNPQDGEIKKLMEELGFNEGQKAMASANYKGKPMELLSFLQSEIEKRGRTAPATSSKAQPQEQPPAEATSEKQQQQTATPAENSPQAEPEKPKANGKFDF